MKKTIEIILARGGSKGIPKKNIFPLAGHPLISYSIFAAKKSKSINDLIIFSDSPKIKKIARACDGWAHCN